MRILGSFNCVPTAAKIIGKTLRAWQYYESGERGMDRSLYQFFIWKTNRQSFIDNWDNYAQISKYLSQLLPLCSLPVGSALNISDVYEDEGSDVLADKLIKLEHNSSEYYLSLPTQSELIDLIHFTRILWEVRRWCITMISSYLPVFTF